MAGSLRAVNTQSLVQGHTAVMDRPEGGRLRLLFLVTEDWFFCSHFLARALAAKSAGYEVFVAARESVHGQMIRDNGFALFPLRVERRSVNPLSELRMLHDILGVYHRVKPDIVHHVAAKPILYGSLVARLLGVPRIVNAPVGMGYVFSSMDWGARLLRPLLSLGFRLLLNPPRSTVVFENGEDMAMFVDRGVVRAHDSALIRGAGIDLAIFSPHPPPPEPPVIMLVARMLRDKGVAEFVAAAHRLHDESISARFVLVGSPDPGNPASISTETLTQWHGVKGVEWWGWRENVHELLAQAHIACLPSYREGLPKSLLEAAACGLPIVTSDTTGCRDVVIDGQTGLLVPVRNEVALAEALKTLILDPQLREVMGRHGRAHVAKEFSTQRVVAETLQIYARGISSSANA